MEATSAFWFLFVLLGAWPLILVGLFALARRYFDGSVANLPVTLTIRAANSGQCELRFNTVRGFYYKLQFTPDFAMPFADDPSGFVQAFDTFTVRADNATIPRNMFRVVQTLAP